MSPDEADLRIQPASFGWRIMRGKRELATCQHYSDAVDMVDGIEARQELVQAHRRIALLTQSLEAICARRGLWTLFHRGG